MGEDSCPNPYCISQSAGVTRGSGNRAQIKIDFWGRNRSCLINYSKTEGRILINLDQRQIVLRQELRKIIEQIEATLHLPALDKKFLDAGQVKVLQLAGRTPIITNEARLLKAKHR
jgi:hypothetical protein